jgi:hypothetical protein
MDSGSPSPRAASKIWFRSVTGVIRFKTASCLVRDSVVNVTAQVAIDTADLDEAGQLPAVLIDGGRGLRRVLALHQDGLHQPRRRPHTEQPLVR